MLREAESSKGDHCGKVAQGKSARRDRNGKFTDYQSPPPSPLPRENRDWREVRKTRVQIYERQEFRGQNLENKSLANGDLGSVMAHATCMMTETQGQGKVRRHTI
jgi:hypothetical protein